MAKKKRKKKPPVATLYKEYFLNMQELVKAFVTVSSRIHSLFPYECPNYGLILEFPALSRPTVKIARLKHSTKVKAQMDAPVEDLISQMVNDAARRIAPEHRVFTIKNERREWVTYLDEIHKKYVERRN